MHEQMINSAFGTKIWRVKTTQKDLYRVTLDGEYAGKIKREGSGWMLEETVHEELTSENVQTIGGQIDKLPWTDY